VNRRGRNGKDDELVPVAAEEPADERAPEGEGSDDAATPAGLAEVAQAPDDAAALRKERDELKEALLRRRAEFENYRRRVERDQAAAATDATADVLRRLVGTVDNLERALAAAPGEGPLRHGVELTLRDFQAALEALGVTAVDPLGERFDPRLHQALVHEPVPGSAKGTVAEVFRKGYTYKDRLVRPALVKVASGDAEGGGETGDAGGGVDVQ
jgi:molecular chaperone GrpE